MIVMSELMGVEVIEVNNDTSKHIAVLGWNLDE